MANEISSENARALLQSTQQLRIHWSGVITTHIGYALTLTVAIWGFCLKSYIESGGNHCERESSFILLASALSAIVLGFWRLYTHQLDHAIAGLYPEFILYEGLLCLPPEYGTTGYLIRAVPRVRYILEKDEKEMCAQQKAKAISILVELRRMGRRGHLKFDISALILLLIMLFVSIFNLWKGQLNAWVILLWLLGVGSGLVFLGYGWCHYQRESSESLIRKAVSGLKQDRKIATDTV